MADVYFTSLEVKRLASRALLYRLFYQAYEWKHHQYGKNLAWLK